MSQSGAGGRTRQHCFVIHPLVRLPSEQSGRTGSARLAEAIGLAQAIDLIVDHAEVMPLSAVRPGTLLGSGNVERIKHLIAQRAETGDAPVDLVIIDRPVTPVQQRNLERAWDCKVIDRTGLILEIFGARARTGEGAVQVELAALVYQRSRLVRSWTHLERQRGGFGFLGGPGETQIETDRRLIGERIFRLKRDLEQIRRTRALHRTARQRVPYPVVALVGYTNAGKSTLFNRLTAAAVFVKDQLFATLDPTMRQLRLPSGRRVILSDTVGFISDLPHELIEAFRATLEEVTTADIVLHVGDASHPDAAAQKVDVETVLGSLEDADARSQPVIEVLNKIDLLTPDERERLAARAARMETPAYPISARTGEGCEALLAAIDRAFEEGLQIVDLLVPAADGALLAWLYDHGEVLAREDRDDGTRIAARLSPVLAGRLHRRLEGTQAGGDAAAPAAQAALRRPLSR